MSNENNFLIEVINLSKKFDNVIAVNEISFYVKQGEVFGFLGPNGAGKTTTINMLTGLSRPDSGTIKIAGQDCIKNPKKAQHLIGIVAEESNLYPELSGFENLCFCASLYGLHKKEREEKAKILLDKFNLNESANRKFGSYSKGMKRKLTIAAGIIHNPKILFLDEPTTGIDVASARQIRQLILELHNTGTTIFLTTHYIEEAERLCDRIAFIVKGKIVKTDIVRNLLQPLQGRQVMIISVSDSADNLSDSLASAFANHEFHPISSEQIRIESELPISLGPIIRFIEERKIIVKEARRLKLSLEDVFVNVTGIEADILRKEMEKKGGAV